MVEIRFYELISDFDLEIQVFSQIENFLLQF